MKKFLILSLGAIFLLAAATVQAAYPDRTITMIVPFAAGGNTDMVARALVPSLQKELGVKIIVKNVGGAGGTLGTAELAASRPDGYTIGYLPTGPVVLQPSIRKLPYTPEKLQAVACVSDTPYVFMVKSDSPMNNLADAGKALAANPGKLAYGSSGPGTLPHLASAAMVAALGGQAKHIPDRSSAEGMKSLAGGVIQFFTDSTSFLPAFDVKALGVFSAVRNPDYPDIPTMKEQGFDLEFSIWGGVFAPAGTPPDVVERLDKAVQAAVNTPEFQDIAKKNSVNALYMDSRDFAAFVAAEAKSKEDLIVSLGLKQ